MSILVCALICHGTPNLARCGCHASIVTYGETTAGKTYTMTGEPNKPGVLVLAMADLIKRIRSMRNMEFLLRASYVHLHNEQLYDLLADDGTGSPKPYCRERSWLSNLGSPSSQFADLQCQSGTECRFAIVLALSVFRPLLVLPYDQGPHRHCFSAGL